MTGGVILQLSIELLRTGFGLALRSRTIPFLHVLNLYFNLEVCTYNFNDVLWHFVFGVIEVRL